MMSAARDETKKKPEPRRAKEVPEVAKGTREADYPRRMNCATAAQLLGISPSHLRHITSTGKCPAVVRHGKRVTYDRDLLLSWRPGEDE